MFSLSLYIFAPNPPPGSFITAAFSSQRGNDHLHREGLTSQVTTKPSVRLINSVAIKMQVRRKPLWVKKGRQVGERAVPLLDQSLWLMFVIHLQTDVVSADKIAINSNNPPYIFN